MRRSSPSRPLLLAAMLGLALLPRAAAADAQRSQDVMALVHADQWDAAQAAAASYLDPVAGKLVRYFRLMAPATSSATDIDSFMKENPDWPAQGTLARRREEALAIEPDAPTALALCDASTPHLAITVQRCADAWVGAGRTDEADAARRRVWTEGDLPDAAAELQYLRGYGGLIGPAEQWQRYAALAWAESAAGAAGAGGNPALKRQAARLSGTWREAAAVRLALRTDDKKADALYAALPAVQRADPLLMLEAARHLRRSGNDAAAVKLWGDLGEAAQHAAPAERLPAFWAERNRLAREVLDAGDAQSAYALAAGHGQRDAEPAADAEFLAGFIALRKLNDPALALPHFRALARSTAVITQGRAHYWLARTAAAAGDAEGAKHEFQLAAAWTTSFYGQLAGIALGDDAAGLTARIAAVKEPAWDPPHALAFASKEIARAATLLVLWGDAGRARPFLHRLDEIAADPSERALTARLALGFGQPDEAIGLARRAGRDGLMLPESGWPVPITLPPDTDAPLVLGLIRQESSFDSSTTSGPGARGLMQLMPDTARLVAKTLGEKVTPAALTLDQAKNIRLGATYVRGLIDDFGGTLPLAIAGYNAGPGRVSQWLAQHGDPRSGVDMVDWIELIPFAETRNYVQRVIENMEVYRARLGIVAPHPLVASAG